MKQAANAQSVEDRALSSTLFFSQLGSTQDMNDKCGFSPPPIRLRYCDVVVGSPSPIMEA